MCNLRLFTQATATAPAADEGSVPVCWPECAGVLVCFWLFLALRVGFIGHFLGYDEAANICTLRSFAAGGQDAYSGWFWRHPPLYLLSLLPLRPLEAGFIERAQATTLLFWSAATLLLYWLNRRLCGKWVALASLLLLAVMPGARLFDAWIKQECLVVCFGLAALLSWHHGRPLLTGLWLGLALLSKEFGVFFAIAIFLTWLLQPRANRHWRDLLAAAGVTVLIAGWWYLFFSTSIRNYLTFATGHAFSTTAMHIAEVRNFSEPWYCYLVRLPADLGWPGLLLAAGGVPAAFFPGATAGTPEWRRQFRAAWPLLLIVAMAPVLLFSAGKMPWFLMILYAAFATLQALAAASLCARANRKTAFGFGLGLVLVCAVAALDPAPAQWNYERLHARIFPLPARAAAEGARETAMLLNTVTRPGERILMTPNYWYEGGGDVIDPPLVAHLAQPLNVLPAKSAKIPPEIVAKIARGEKLDWVLISSDPGADGVSPIVYFRRELGLRPLMPGHGEVLLYHTTSLWADNGNTKP